MTTSAKRYTIQELMHDSGVGFGTSGARGLVSAMTHRICYAYTIGFLQHLSDSGRFHTGDSVAIAGDLRPSSKDIMTAVAKAVTDFGATTINCGTIPTPAVTLYGIWKGTPSIMITGSHIPDDRNGIKFNTADGEILKQDEESIRSQSISIPEDLFDDLGSFTSQTSLPDVNHEAYSYYLDRYIDLFPNNCLQGTNVGVYEHSSVARDLICELLSLFGAKVHRLGRSNSFVPVDTEAIRQEDIALGKQWASENQLDTIVSTDGDADRPLISDEHGNWLRGDIAGILCAKYLGIKNISTPVSSNSAVEKCGWFNRVSRTRIGSPYVIRSMQDMASEGISSIAGYEANGGFLIGDQIEINGSILDPLPTRDAVIVMLSILLLSRHNKKPISELLQNLPQRFTTSNRLKDYPTAASMELLQRLNPGETNDYSSIEAMFSVNFGRVQSVDHTDGLRITFSNLEIVHLRPSGNAPELRCYNEADSESRALDMNRICLQILEKTR